MLNETDIRGLGNFLSRQSSEETPPTFSSGQLLDTWQITGFLGRGGTSEVYRVLKSWHIAAAKVLTKLDAASCRRFAAEVSLVEGGDVPGTPHCFASGEIDGHPYAILELLEPIDVPQNEKEIAAYLLSVCDAVAALHRSGYVHRDLKPKNIMRRANGEIVLIDFGLVKDTAQSVLPRSDVSIVDGKPVGVGTPDYAAPEQWLGGEASPAADIHALGRIANAAFNGKPPRNWLPIIRRATSSIPEQRYKTVEEFAAAIRHRNFPRHIAICLGGLAAAVLVAGVFVLRGSLSAVRDLTEQMRFDSLCSEMFATNVVQEELVKVVYRDMGGFKIPAERYHQVVTNQVRAVQISLRGITNSFVRPIHLAGDREYWVSGPGVLEGIFRAEGTNVTMRLKSCIMRNHAAEPMSKAGIFYDLQDGAGLEFPDLDEPDDHGRHHIERSGSPTKLSFKKVD